MSTIDEKTKELDNIVNEMVNITVDYRGIRTVIYS